MAFLCFDLLPAHRLPRERSARDLAFGKNPLGSGPFMLDSITGDEVVFKVNPHYRRPQAPAGPALSEIRFIRYGNFIDARSALASGRWQMLLHLTTAEREQLAGVDHTFVATPTEQPDGANLLANPRIWFLAPNYRKPAWRDENLRHAISLSLDREGLLQEVFRGQGKKQHRALTGPFPLGSWAYNPDLTPDKVSPFNPSMARQRAQSSGFSGTLKLRFPGEDEQAARACAAIQKAVEQHAGLRLTPEPMPSSQIASDLASDNPTFDLLYWYYDFPNETLSLWPLLDPRAISPNGQNYFGYRGDSELERLFRLIQSRRDFEFVRRRSHEVHEHLWRKMVFIPLWQLDVHVAMHVSLEARRLHPLYVFEEVETWRRKLD
jgi:ABC-type transport system substrate-binding protein